MHKRWVVKDSVGIQELDGVLNELSREGYAIRWLFPSHEGDRESVARTLWFTIVAEKEKRPA